VTTLEGVWFESTTALATELAATQPIEPDVREEPVRADPTQPQSFADFVGQAEVVRLLRTEVEAARRERRSLSHMLLYGPPGVGKTALAFVLAGEMGNLPIYESSGAEFSNQTDVLAAAGSIGRLFDVTGKPIVWIIDEADGMTRVASYPLHTLMTHGYVQWRGERYGGVPVTVLATTNHIARVPRALKSRFNEIVLIDYYGPSELAEIARRSAARMGFSLKDDAAAFIGENAAGEPRKVNRRILRGIANLLDGRTVADLDTAREALKLSGLRPKGLTRSQFEYLSFLAACEDHTAGINSISAFLSEDPADVRDHEAFLIRSGFVTVTRGGRKLTDKGQSYLLAPA
jgi:Holliday junction DNA helicase RuvB